MTSRLAGRYEIHREIAAGGMATVHIGRDMKSGGAPRAVAVKRLHAQFAKDPEFAAMLLDEARLTSRISHPNVVATLDAVAQDGELFVVMEYVRGETLSHLLGAVRARNERIPPAIAASIAHGVLLGLHAAHEAVNERGEPLHIVHRDVSPQNVLVGSDGLARVLDFGVAKAKGRSRTTTDGQIRGKIGYMAPEQLHGEEVTRRTDVYAAAIVLWETLTCTRLFDGETEAEVIGKVAKAVAPPPSLYAPDVPKGIDAVTLRGLVRDPRSRYATAKAMAESLASVTELASHAAVGAWVESVVGDVLRERSAIAATLPPPSTPPGGPRRAAFAALMVLASVVGIASIAVIISVRARHSDEPTLYVESADSPVAAPDDLPRSAGAPGASGAPAASGAASSTAEPAPTAAPEPATSAVPAAGASAPSDLRDASVAPPPKLRPRAQRRAGCEPPFTIDAAGRRHFKVECL